MSTDQRQLDAHFLLASDRLEGYFRHAQGDKVLTLRTRGRVLGQAVFSGIHVGVKCEMSMWMERERGLAARDFLRDVFGVAFNQWHCLRVTTVTRASNTVAQEAIRRLGFRFEAPLEAWFGNEPGWIFKMLRADCPWLRR